MKHGLSGYTNDQCKCEICSEAHLEYGRRWAEANREKTREYYKNYRDKNKEAVATRQRAKRDKFREDINQRKIDAGCADCGFNLHPIALDFDHVSGEKVRNVGNMNNCSQAAIDAEIAKCEVVCANCHRIRTWNRKQYNNWDC